MVINTQNLPMVDIKQIIQAYIYFQKTLLEI